MADDFQDRTERATPKRRQEARQRGQVAKSMELNSVFVLLVGFIVLYLAGGVILGQLVEVSCSAFGGFYRVELTEGNVYSYFFQGLKAVGLMLLPVIVPIVVVGVLANFGQVGFLLTPWPLVPRLDRLNPVSGFKRLFSKRSLQELIKGVLKIVIVGYIAYITIKGEYADFFPLMDRDVGQIAAFVGGLTFRTGIRTALALLVLALFDYAFQRWEYERNLRMTKQEVREELKQMEGDPQVRSRIRSIQLRIARQRMMRAVPEADVVITNPVFLAVALKYSPETMAAPTVVAKGARLIAEKIKEVAEKYRVPIVEDKPLAQALYYSVEVGMEIPYQFYQAVAEILAYVYRLKGRRII